jgi:hypothetical protein
LEEMVWNISFGIPKICDHATHQVSTEAFFPCSFVPCSQLVTAGQWVQLTSDSTNWAYAKSCGQYTGPISLLLFLITASWFL